jgi:uncharacterized GH25 family protein
MSGRLRGKVFDEAGQAVAEASVVVIQAPGRVPDIAAVSDANGRFSFGRVRDGRYTLRALGPEGQTGEDDAVVPERDAVILLNG